MSCSPELIEAWMDEELDASQHASVAQHIAECAACTTAAARLREQKAAIRAQAPYFNAPSALRQSVRNALRKEARTGGPWRGWAIAASVLLAVSLSWNVLSTRRNDAAEAVLADHIRSLIGTHLIDVPSSDQHTVKPWFAGQLDFSPEVKDLSAAGFPLAGGRVDYLEGRRVAALVYRRRQHVINLFIWPGGSGESRTSRDGYHALHWSDGRMTYWAASDVSADELERFRSLYR